MAYASWSVVFGEQPSAAKWNILGTNDASFNDGTGITALTIGSTTNITNQYTFRAYRTAAHSTTGGAFTKVPYDTESWDTNANFDAVTNRRYVAPETAKWQFNARVSLNPNTAGILALYKNGSVYARGTAVVENNTIGMNVSDVMTMAATDYAEIFLFATTGNAIEVGSEVAYFSGFYIGA